MASNEEGFPVLKISVDNTDDLNLNLDENEPLDIDTSDLQYGGASSEARSGSAIEDRPLEVDTSKSSFDQKVCFLFCTLDLWVRS